MTYSDRAPNNKRCSAAWRERKAALGLCNVCGRTPPQAGFKSCYDCRSRKAQLRGRPAPSVERARAVSRPGPSGGREQLRAFLHTCLEWQSTSYSPA